MQSAPSSLRGFERLQHLAGEPLRLLSSIVRAESGETGFLVPEHDRFAFRKRVPHRAGPTSCAQPLDDVQTVPNTVAALARERERATFDRAGELAADRVVFGVAGQIELELLLRLEGGRRPVRVAVDLAALVIGKDRAELRRLIDLERSVVVGTVSTDVAGFGGAAESDVPSPNVDDDGI